MCTADRVSTQLLLTNIYHIISYIISYHIISYHIISYHIISYHIISYHIISYHIISYHIISYHIIWPYHVCLSVRPHGTTRLPADGSSRNLIFECSSKLFLLGMRNISDKFVETIKKRILRTIIFFFSFFLSFFFFFFNHAFCEIMWKNMTDLNRTTDDNIIRGMPFPCWMTKAKRSHSEYAILPTFPRRQWLRGKPQCYVGYTSTLTYSFVTCNVKVKGKVHPRTGHVGPERE